MPPIRELQALIAEQQAGVAPQKALIDADIVANATAGTAQEAGLGAIKDREFKQIGQRSQNKGMFFSGFSPNEEAEYTAGTYLPALAQLQATIAQTRSNLLGKKATLDTDIFNRATDIRENDITQNRNWTLKQQEIAEQRAEAERQRQFTAAQNQADRNASASASRASSAAKAGPSPVQQMAAALGSKVGGDGYVSPGTYAANKNQWVAGGYGSAQQFDSAFGGFRNPKNKYYKLG